MGNELSDQKLDTLAQYGRIHNKGRREHCPVCFKAYELIDNELVETCSHLQDSNICGRHGLNNHNCGS